MHTNTSLAGLPDSAARLPATPEELEPSTKAFYLNAMDVLDRAGVPFLVGGAYSMAYHAGIIRHTKDFDVFVRLHDSQRALDALNEAGYPTELTFPHWLGKAFEGEAFVDVIFSSGNGLCPVDDEWFKNAIDGESLGRPVKVCPAEEVIWSKSFVMERERYDGADIAHLILARGKTLDWERLLRRFKGKERVLLAHLVLFNFIYPNERNCIPDGVLERLFKAAQNDAPLNGHASEKVCQGTFISRQQYLIDIRERGYRDARLRPQGPMKPEEVAHWTAAINTIR